MEKASTAVADGKTRSAGLGGRAWSFFNSVKLTLFILITLAIVCIFGTFIQQGESLDTYIQEYGEFGANLIRALNLDDMYHSNWFASLLVLLSINITVCTIDRFPAKWKTLTNEATPIDTSIIKRLSNRDSFTASAYTPEMKDAVAALLTRRGFKVRSEEEGGTASIYAWRGKLGRFGSDFTHLSLLIILVGAIIGIKWGYRDFRPIFEGGIVDVPQVDFYLKLDKFWIDYYDSGQIKQYNSNLTVIENGKELFTKQIWVNEPLLYKGIRFYQSSYGTAYDRVKEANLLMVKRVPGTEMEISEPVTILWKGDGKIPGTPYTAKLIGYVSDFVYGAPDYIYDDELRVTSLSRDSNNPAIWLEIYEGEKLISDNWIFLNYPLQYDSRIKDTDYELVLASYIPTQFSGISVTKDPGTNVVWVGTIIMCLGTYFSFFVFYRRVWVRLEQKNSATEVSLGGMINKNNIVFEREFKELAAEARTVFAVAGEKTK